MSGRLIIDYISLYSYQYKSFGEIKCYIILTNLPRAESFSVKLSLRFSISCCKERNSSSFLPSSTAGLGATMKINTKFAKVHGKICKGGEYIINMKKKVYQII